MDKKSEFSVLVDRATGGSSIKDGEVELMLHRYISKKLFILYFNIIVSYTNYWHSMFTTQGAFFPTTVEELGNHSMKKFA
jgi:hypothetical protein